MTRLAKFNLEVFGTIQFSKKGAIFFLLIFYLVFVAFSLLLKQRTTHKNILQKTA